MRGLLICICCGCFSSLVWTQNVSSDRGVAEPVEERTTSVSGLWGQVDFLYWKPHLRGFDFATTEDGTANALGAGQIHEVGFDRDVGFRTQLGYTTNAHWSADVGYTHFSTDGRASATRPPGVGQLFATLSHPGGPEEADSANAAASFDLNVFDLLARYPIVRQRFIGIDLFGGLRWASIQHDVRADYNGRDFISAVTQEEVDIQGFGFRAGATTRWRLAGGWSLFGQGAVAALYGNIESQRTETNLSGAQTLVDLRHEYNQPIFNLDTAVGLGWRTGRFAIDAGYDMSIWTGTSERIRFVDDIEEAAFVSDSGDILLEGLFVRATMDW